MPSIDLSQLLGGETERVEWKESHRNNNVILRSVCALANDLGGSNEPEYPLDALKELVRNTIQHRQYEGTNAPARIEWYSDRIELTNPGSPFGRASEGELGEHSDYRNPLLTGVLVRLGYVERLGRGVRRVRKLLRDAGLPPLEVVTNGFTRTIVRRRP